MTKPRSAPRDVRGLSRAARALGDFFRLEAAGGIVLIAAAALALLIANSPLSGMYARLLDLPLQVRVGDFEIHKPLLLWINDGLMAVFFLLVALEIKRETLSGQLAGREQLLLPLACASAGVALPALLFVAFNHGDAAAMRGWAVPTATDIAFALGVLALLGARVPVGMKLLLSTIAVVDDLIAILIIALFYSHGMSFVALAWAAVALAAMWILNRRGVTALTPYLLLGVLLWVCVRKSGVHATLAGVALALTIPLKVSPGSGHDLDHSPLHRLEHGLHKIVPFIVIPIFGFANAGVSLAGLSAAALVEPLTLGVAAGLVLGKLVGVFGSSALAIRLGFADLPVNAGWLHMIGISLLCGIGFTMSLFIGLLAFANDVALQDAVKVGILAGSFIAALLGAAVLLMAPAVGEIDED
jgi:NhaA family Na+:H+ antiporter